MKDVEIEGKGKRGRRKKPWNDGIREDLQLCKMSDVLSDRVVWRKWKLDIKSDR